MKANPQAHKQRKDKSHASKDAELELSEKIAHHTADFKITAKQKHCDSKRTYHNYFSAEK